MHKGEEGVDADKIAPGLYIGSVPRSCGSFDAVVLAAWEYQDVSLRCLVIRAPLEDAAPTKQQVKLALLAARQVHALLRAGNKVLVTCAQGRNRSALIVGLALMMDGMSAKQAIRRIVEKRKGAAFGAKALTNSAFVRVLERYESIKK